MITKATALKIAVCYDEIEKADALLAKVTQELEAGVGFPDDLGRSRFELGVPMSSTSGHRLFDVTPELALAVIQAHKAKKQAKLVEYNEVAKLEANGAL